MQNTNKIRWRFVWAAIFYCPFYFHAIIRRSIPSDWLQFNFAPLLASTIESRLNERNEEKTTVQSLSSWIFKYFRKPTVEHRRHLEPINSRESSLAIGTNTKPIELHGSKCEQLRGSSIWVNKQHNK